MLPPIDPATFSANPKFNALYQDLCNNKLNKDASSKLDAKAQRERDSLSEDRRKARKETAKRDLIKSRLQNSSYQAGELPEELQELALVVAGLLEGQIPEEDRKFLQDDLTKFKENIKTITTALSKQLQRDSNSLASMIDPNNPPPINNIPKTVSQLKNSISTSHSSLAGSRLALAKEAIKLHNLYRRVLETSINILEQTIHGSVARGAKAKADYLALVAEGMSKKLSLQHGQLMSQLYSPEVQEALGVKLEDLRVESLSVKRKVRECEEKLEEYRSVGGMEGLAWEYAEVLEESERVRGEIERVGGARE